MNSPLRLMTSALSTFAEHIIVLNAAKSVVFASKSVESLLGRRELTGLNLSQMLCADGGKKPVLSALDQGETVRVLLHAKNSKVKEPMHVQACPLFIGERCEGFLLVLSSVPSAFLHEHGEAVEQMGMLTQSDVMKEALRIVSRVAEEDVTVLIRGDTGTGKELVARAIHTLSSRKKGPFRAINCAALPPALLESELFGHTRGAFTGAVRDAPGHLLLSNGGTLFLDEISEMPLELQAKLLRVIETRTVIPVGGRDAVQVDVRFVSATHRSLRAEVERGRFRADLMYRLRVVPVFLPPLRERLGDIQLLLFHFIEEFNKRGRRQIRWVAPEALSPILNYAFPGNVRELRNVVEHAFALGEGSTMKLTDLPPELREVRSNRTETTMPFAETSASTTQSLEKRQIQDALTKANGHRDQAAQLLGISRITLWRRMKELGLRKESK